MLHYIISSAAAPNLQSTNHMPDVPGGPTWSHISDVYSEAQPWGEVYLTTATPDGLSGHGDVRDAPVASVFGSTVPTDCYDPRQHQALASGSRACLRALGAEQHHAGRLFPQAQLRLQFPRLPEDLF